MAYIDTTRHRDRRADRRDFRLIYAAAFVLSLLVAIGSRFVPRAWRPAPFGASNRRSVFAEAKAGASMITPFAFMG